jgi:hypothetical protein
VNKSVSLKYAKYHYIHKRVKVKSKVSAHNYAPRHEDVYENGAKHSELQQHMDATSKIYAPASMILQEGLQKHNGQWMGGPHSHTGHVAMGGIHALAGIFSSKIDIVTERLAVVLTGKVEAVPVFNYAPRGEDECGSDVTTPHILTASTR